jgi:hypothetical protein
VASSLPGFAEILDDQLCGQQKTLPVFKSTSTGVHHLALQKKFG